METRANFILIGAFTLAGMIGIVAMIMWFAHVELDRQFDYYDIHFSSVSGLSAASDVRFSGLPVGQVVDVRLSPDQDGTILVRVEVDAITPVRVDSIATIESQGVTGVSYVQIGPGTPSLPLLRATEDMPVPEITAGRSVIQALSEDAPELITQTLDVIEGVNQLFGPDNQAQIERILANVAGASDTFTTALEGFSEFAGSANTFASEISSVSKLFINLSDDIEGLMQNANNTLTTINALSGDAKILLDTGTTALDAAGETFTEAELFLSEDLAVTTEALRTTLVDLQAEIAAIGASAQTMMTTFNTTGTTATTRLTEAEATIASVDAVLARLTETIGTVDAAAARFDVLLETQGAPLLTEARATIAQVSSAVTAISTVAETDLPEIMTEIRRATETAAAVITEVGADLSGATGRIDELSLSANTALTTVTNTFNNANETLTAINRAMETGNRTLEAAEGAFVGADRFINDDMAQVIEGLQTSMTALNGAIDQVSSDIPVITADLRSASQSAEAAFSSLQGAITQASPSVSDFARTGLPLYTRLAEETRALIRNLDRLTNQIQRDPTRFFLDRQSPEFRR
jgi:phospholipid/cholesterol/gamma-HCH transport system substrate-binding protein